MPRKNAENPSKFQWTDKRRRFCEEFIKDLNGTQAAIRAGFSEKSAADIAVELKYVPEVTDYIQKLMDERAKRTQIDADTILVEIFKIAKSDLRKLFDEKGRILSPTDWPDDMAAAVSSIEIDELFEGQGNERSQVGLTKRVRFWDKVKSLELLGKHLKLFTEVHEHKVDESLAETLRKARERAKARQ